MRFLVSSIMLPWICFVFGCTETLLRTEYDGDRDGTPCASDLDCKGDRICVDGICKEPGTEGDEDWDTDPYPMADRDRETEDELDLAEADGDRNESEGDGDVDRELETVESEHEEDGPDRDLDGDLPENEVEGCSESDVELDCELDELTCNDGFTCVCNVLYECVDGYWEEAQDCRWDSCVADEGICRVERALKFNSVESSTKLSIESESASVCEREYWTIEMWIKTLDDGSHSTLYQDSLECISISVTSFRGVRLTLQEAHAEAENVRLSESVDVEAGWHHVSVVRDYTFRRMYLDGLLVVEDDPTHKTEERTYAVTYIGYSSILTLDEVRISDVARYTEDFEPQTRYEPDENTLSLWHMDEGVGDVTYDEVGGAEGALEGNVSWTAGVGSWSE